MGDDKTVQTDRQDKPDNNPSPVPLWDPDHDGKPGISWPSVAVVGIVAVAVTILALNEVIDLNDLLINGGLGTALGAALMRLRKPKG